MTTRADDDDDMPSPPPANPELFAANLRNTPPDKLSPSERHWLQYYDARRAAEQKQVAPQTTPPATSQKRKATLPLQAPPPAPASRPISRASSLAPIPSVPSVALSSSSSSSDTPMATPSVVSLDLPDFLEENMLESLSTHASGLESALKEWFAHFETKPCPSPSLQYLSARASIIKALWVFSAMMELNEFPHFTKSESVMLSVALSGLQRCSQLPSGFGREATPHSFEAAVPPPPPPTVPSPSSPPLSRPVPTPVPKAKPPPPKASKTPGVPTPAANHKPLSTPAPKPRIKRNCVIVHIGRRSHYMARFKGQDSLVKAHEDLNKALTASGHAIRCLGIRRTAFGNLIISFPHTAASTSVSSTFDAIRTGLLFPTDVRLSIDVNWSFLQLANVPTKSSPDAISPYSVMDLLTEVRSNPAFKDLKYTRLPSWVSDPKQLTKQRSSIAFAFEDPSGTLADRLRRGDAFMFGANVTIKSWLPRAPRRPEPALPAMDTS